MLAPETTPALAAWSEGARVFANHLSGGNSTRFGLFSLLYGLHGSYWFPVASERRSPVLIDALVTAGYDVRFYSSASMDFVELRTTTCARIPERVFDDFAGSESWQRDEQASRACAEWLRERAWAARPFFAFLMLDAPHQTYSYPPEHEVFTPAAAELDYMAVSSSDGPPPGVLAALRNRYKNAVHFADSAAARVLAALEETGLAGETLVVVTGDHGEEFMEHGYFGHTSTHGPLQVRVPFLLRGPGIEPGVEPRPTAHVDLAPTLLERLGADPERRGLWTLGESLLSPPEERRRVVAGWNELGLWTPDGILRIRLGATPDVGLYDYDWRFVPQDWDVLERQRIPLERLSEECNRFLR
jgi:membrane-anchored protein YejM (alkaline phosphatase superfamily)